MTAQTTSATAATGERESRHAPLILTLFGLYARGEHNWLAVASLIGLMADLGVESRAVRSSVSRMKRREVLRGERREGVAGYSLADSTLQTLAEGDVRIFHRARACREDGWVLVVFSVPESEREKRHALRTALTRLGFGTIASGVWVAPGHLADEARRTLERRGLSGYVDLFTGDHFASRDLGAKVRSWWDLDELTAMYADFLDRYRPVLEAVTRREPQPLEAFRIYLPMLTEWRRMPYRDPGLPLELLPPEWNGVAAGELFDRLNIVLSTPAAAHAAAVLHGPR
ncbi:PaaX family transcriptional regulator C-terminal domain-containing protein [Streptomyces rapamycinicus]|uniref:PaaX family transcriptional regulator n=2 Tax=Streptomyces rapamycinicus TaxID=1226757 RepID=A0A0A0N737_STRRN|nr:PaaX family transcriptional regulator C-terminal domain-containing protein [Streptomyces rapamycinicus]AGP51778.1 PaaX family transcripitonal regulator [Streptomyces rapamycinicus NRRL 5491]MBB4779192.1 phenylacetic acid degradation operon negative regulatory protein [Streptomyces rapamycinicus]RLV76142.1 PaaX family transcriptional regulator [Streptomyces rapamycinicus NRRL 5491]UTP28004.1 PaaX family transcriptional regulator [Streptomyces rapamycinicus NRRL 5491]